jgi:hypothetical protein
MPLDSEVSLPMHQLGVLAQTDSDQSNISGGITEFLDSFDDGPSKIVERHAAAISNASGRSLDDILNLSAACAEAKHALHPQAKRELYELLSFKRTKFSMLAAFGWNQALRKLEIKQHLPAKLRLLHLMKDSDDTEIDKAITDGVLSPRAKYQDLKAWIDQYRANQYYFSDLTVG